MANEEGENEDINELRRRFDMIPVEQVQSIPKTWADVHSLKCLTKNTGPLTFHLLTYPTKLLHPIDAVSLAIEFSPIAFLSIASGEKHKVVTVHSLNYISAGEDTRTLALTGARTRSTPVQLIPQQFFKTVQAWVPSLESFVDGQIANSDVKNIPTSQHVQISHSIPIPAHFAVTIMPNTPNLAGILLKRTLDTCVRLDIEEFEKNTTEEDEDRQPGPSDMHFTSAHLPLLQHLFAFAKMKSARQVGFTLADDEYANEWAERMDSRLATQRRIYIDNSEDESDDEQTDNNNTNTDSQNPQVSFESSERSRPQHNPQHQHSNNNSRPSHFTFTGSHNPAEKQSTGNQTPTHHNTSSIDPNTTVISAIENMTNNHSRFTHQMERLVNATATKFNDDGKKKIGAIIKQVICNAATCDGENPSEDLTRFAKDVLSLPGDQPLLLLEILFQKHKVRAKATPKFISAMRKGNLTYDNMMPDGLSITQLPQSLQGTEFEDTDIGRLTNMEENGTINENDSTNMHKSILQVSRTLHFLLDKSKAWTTFCMEFFGIHSYVALEAEGWTTWISENFIELQEIKSSRDKDLPAKIEIAISEQFNKIF
eukprot:scaffold26896_cov44-Cyclotella_meneghiniana.AAC.1